MMKKYYLLGFLMGNVLGIVVPLTSIFLDNRQISSDWIGAVSSTYFFAMVIGAKLFPILLRRFPAYRLVPSALIISSGFILCFVNTDQMALWFLSMFIIGIGVSFNFITMQNALAENSIHKTCSTGFYTFCFSMGFVCSVLIGTSLYRISEWIPFAYASILILIDAYLIYRFKVQIAVTSSKHSAFRMKGIYTLLFGGFVFGYIENTFSALYPIYLLDYMGVELAGAVLGAFLIGGNIAVIPLCRKAQKWGAYKSCCLFSLFTLIGFAGIVWTPYKILFTILAGGFACAIYPVTLAGLSDAGRGSDQSLSMTGAYTMCHSLGSAIGPVVVGNLMHRFGNNTLLYVSILLVSAFLGSNISSLLKNK